MSDISQQHVETYNDKVVGQFAIMTIGWEIVGMAVGVYIAAEFYWPQLNFLLTCDHLQRPAPSFSAGCTCASHTLKSGTHSESSVGPGSRRRRDATVDPALAREHRGSPRRLISLAVVYLATQTQSDEPGARLSMLGRQRAGSSFRSWDRIGDRIS